ncbi:hypothetical protein NEOLEDRAFT_1150968 [Neolentinus lepideus HHB14362 ss-1]|uniref:Uncharacterized protein n=1 Tax=Neolentinus lepideus HHB14362 ss-1 TaxID=1314782 RepID=A0A165PFL5_9AGAM|nr:hypothetical protein NEOLEDRAFT_1150968 [Neolentinus lepideus HHB14362 ss-1]
MSVRTSVSGYLVIFVGDQCFASEMGQILVPVKTGLLGIRSQPQSERATLVSPDHSVGQNIFFASWLVVIFPTMNTDYRFIRLYAKLFLYQQLVFVANVRNLRSQLQILFVMLQGRRKQEIAH